MTMVIVARHYRGPGGGLGTPLATMTCESDKGNVALSQSPNAYRGHLVTRDYAPATMPWHNRQAMSPSGAETLNMVMDMDEVVTLDVLSMCTYLVWKVMDYIE
ncbi:hypothetical protein L6452_44331 [Arctium lappa]|uniref:Uncharacterized protein n=1 Tax=Arctium lappa TaxID=4217 RepID=A0ACB8XFW3_ARCLA|nr:hypothetical protein L6452_44331 [Arctium lappa]